MSIFRIDNGHKRGFASMSAERRKEIASAGGKAAQATGKAHRFTSEKAREVRSSNGGRKMNTALFTVVMQALDKAARERYAKIGAGVLQSDADAVRCAPRTNQIIAASEYKANVNDVHRILNGRVKHGDVLRYQSSKGGQIHWWPAGLCEKLKIEREMVGDA